MPSDNPVDAGGGNDGGQAQRAGDDRRVGLRPAAGREQGQNLIRIQGRGVRRGEVFGDQDKRGGGVWDARGGDAAQLGDDAGADVQDVGGAFGHVAAQVVQHFRDGSTGFPDGPLAGGAAADQLGGGFQKHGVRRHQCCCLQDCLPVAADGLGAGLQHIVHGPSGSLQGRCRLLGRDPGRELLPGGWFADWFGHLANGSDDAAGADAYSWEVLH